MDFIPDSISLNIRIDPPNVVTYYALLSTSQIWVCIHFQPCVVRFERTLYAIQVHDI
jgi:hypothetical protein